MVKETKWCPQHGYQLPCAKCGLGERETGKSEIISWVDEHIEMDGKQNTLWTEQKLKWGIK